LVASCGLTNVFVAALSSSPQITSETEPERLEALFYIYNGRLDGTLFEAYRAAVANDAASDAFRIEAMRALGALVPPGLDILPPAVDFARRGCRAGNRPDEKGIFIGKKALPAPSTLPSDAVARATATYTAVAASGASARVRFAAWCWQQMLEAATPVDINKISISYECGNKFRMRNANVADVELLTFTVGTNSDSGEFSVPAKGGYLLGVDTTGTLRVYLGRTLVGSAANGGIVCK
jgi:hypothetical protein